MNEVKPQTRMQRIGDREPTDAAEPEHPVLVEGILAFNEAREPTFADPDF